MCMTAVLRKCALRHDPVFFCSSLVKSERTSVAASGGAETGSSESTFIVVTYIYFVVVVSLLIEQANEECR